MRHSPLIAIALSATLAAGCLSSSHVIPRHDLQALAQTDPQTRGVRVRVIQSHSLSDDDPPPAPYATDGSVHVSVGVATPVPSPAPAPSPRGGTSAKNSSDRAAFWIIVAAGAAVVLAATEGARYDGWVSLHPMHPVHLYGWDGQYRQMPLAHITPELAAWSRKAVILDTEGPWQPLGRAPLDRAGWTYSVLLGSSETPIDDQTRIRGFASHIQLGRFLSQEVGVLLDFSLGWADDEAGATLYDSRSALELQLMPLDAGRLHAGAFGQIGTAYRLDDSAAGLDRRGMFYGAGGMLQLELTTRLALTARAGLTALYGERTSDFTVGLSIY